MEAVQFAAYAMAIVVFVPIWLPIVAILWEVIPVIFDKLTSRR